MLQRRMTLIVALLLAAVTASPVLAQVARPDPERTKSSDSLRAVFKSITALANKSTVLIKAGGEGATKPLQVAFGTVISADGYVLTKASEVVGRRHLQVSAGGASDDLHPAKVVGVSEPQDLAMLKVDVDGFTPVQWADLKSDHIEVGAWVATAGPVALEQEEPVAVGVVSVGRRKIPGRLGFLGVSMGDTTDNSGATIQQVIPASAAEKAGVKVGDIITGVDGKPVKSRVDLSLLVREHRPGDVVSLTVKRAAEVKELTATLGTMGELEDPTEFSMMRLLGGAISKRASDFSAVFQHDTVVRPMDCGGPLVDLTGKVIGINIARAGRTETYALPADVILPLIAPLENGKLAPVNANAPDAHNTTKPTTMPERGE